ncbi:MAG: hypothetical protein H6767_06805 [Candidatus Peribacteria bacterium]|nr:MAG: hypothetical protein H6767_06805 [Candidatus Peribacteria bacterium]
MQYSKPQKILSFFLIFFLLVSVTLHVPLMQVFPRAEAVEKESVSLVSLLVQEEIYSGIASRLNRYAEDIQGVLENTRVVILPVPENADPFNIASLNESLYYDGYAGLEAVQFHSRLVGTVIF